MLYLDFLAAVPPPTLYIARTPSTDVVFTSSDLELTCVVTVHPSAGETPTDVITEWIGPDGDSLTSNGGSLQLSSVSEDPQYTLTARLSPLSSSESGTYTCSSHTQPNTSHPFVVASESVNATTTFEAGKRRS